MKAIETFGDEILVRGKARLWLKAPDAAWSRAERKGGVDPPKDIWDIWGSFQYYTYMTS